MKHETKNKNYYTKSEECPCGREPVGPCAYGLLVPIVEEVDVMVGMVDETSQPQWATLD